MVVHTTRRFEKKFLLYFGGSGGTGGGFFIGSGGTFGGTLKKALGNSSTPKNCFNFLADCRRLVIGRLSRFGVKVRGQ